MSLKAVFSFLIGALAGQALSYRILATTVIATTVSTTCVCHESTTPTPYSTSIDLGAAALTGVTVQPVPSPTTCYQLPTPTSAHTPMALPVYQILDTDAMDLVFFYVGDNATVPKYLGSPIAGYTTLLDLSSDASSAGRLAMTFPGNASLVFDKSGVHLFYSGCASVSSLAIDIFWQQVLNITSTPGGIPPARRAFKRAATDESNFTVQVQVNKTATPASPPSVTFGQSPCQF